MIRFLFTTTVLIMLMSLSALPGSIFAAQNDSLIVRRVFALTYPNNPITHSTIKLTNGCAHIAIPGTDKPLVIGIDKVSNVGEIFGNSTPCVAAIIKADSGNGLRYSYVVILQVQKESLLPVAYEYLGSNITLDYFSIEFGRLNIWWLRELTEGVVNTSRYITCRRFELSGNKLIDKHFEQSRKRKLDLESDTIFTDSIKTGAWMVKWNKTRATAFNSTTNKEKQIYESVYADISDIDYILPDSAHNWPADDQERSSVTNDEPSYLPDDDLDNRDKKNFDPDWHLCKNYEMLSVVGPFVSYVQTTDESEFSAPSMDIKVLQLDGDIDSQGTFTGLGSSKAPEDWVGCPEPNITAFFGKSHLLNDLLHIPQLHVLFKDTLPEYFEEFRWDRRVQEIISIWDMERYFYFTSITDDNKVTVRFAPHEESDTMIREVTLSIPSQYLPIFRSAIQNKSTADHLNANFVKNFKSQYVLDWQTAKDTVYRKEQLSQNGLRLYLKNLEAGLYTLNHDEGWHSDDYFKKALEIFPKDKYAAALLRLCTSKNADTIINNCTSVLSIDEFCVPVLLHRGETYAQQSHYDKALADINRAISLDSTHAMGTLYTTRAKIYKSQKRYQQSFDDLNFEIQAHPQNVMAWYQKAMLYVTLVKLDSAITLFEHCVELAPQFLWPYDNLGYCLLDVQDYDKALFYFNKYIEMQDDNPDVYLGAAIAYYCKHNTTQAMIHLEKAISFNAILAKGMDGIAETEKQGYFYSGRQKKELAELFELRKSYKKEVH